MIAAAKARRLVGSCLGFFDATIAHILPLVYEVGGDPLTKIEPHVATLSCSGGETTFAFGEHAIRFRTSEKLKRYANVRVWDKGYLVVDAQYDGMPSCIEEYIDLVPILENLYFDPDKFLEPIEEVRIV